MCGVRWADGAVPAFRTALLVVMIGAWGTAGYALDLVLPQKAFQGDLVVGRTRPGAQVEAAGAALPVGPGGHFAFGVERERKTDIVVTATAGEDAATHTIAVYARPWKIQRINGLPEKYVSPDPETEKRILAEIERIRAVRRAASPSDGLFLEKGFMQPVQGEITGVFGSQRILNGKPSSPHSGVDIAAPRGTPVRAPADGRVCLVDRDMYLTGGTLMVDHGLGVRSIFIHLYAIDVKVGDRVLQGNPIAKVGMTGRATGPHLHWGVTVGDVKIDPQPLPGLRFAN